MEANFDGLVGPTHNYAGLAFGNLASLRNLGAISQPRAAALQGLTKMKALADLGLPQAVLPPQERPHLSSLRRLGFAGSDAQVLARAAREAPRLLAAVSSASSMWAANAATVCPSADAADGRVHFTAANLVSSFHRSIEAEATARTLATIFADPAHFAHHAPLPAVAALGDEGAANHTRLCRQADAPGLQLFVYGQAGDGPGPRRYPARQTLAASQAVARLHGLDPDRSLFLRQNSAAIDAGVFHNDVIAVGHSDLLFHHELAFDPEAWPAVRARLDAGGIRRIEVPAARISLQQAVDSYLFNSQLLSPPDARLRLLVPAECRADVAVWDYLQALEAGDGPIDELMVVDLTQSMRNGGGPACLRLRVELNETERAAVLPGVWLTDALFAQLQAWVGRHYRDQLAEADLADPALLDESRQALDELTRILGLGALYDFQREISA